PSRPAPTAEASPARSAGAPAPPCRPSSAAFACPRSPRLSVFQALGRSVFVEALGGPFARVLGVEGPVGLLLPVALVEHGFVALEGDELGHQGGHGRGGRPVDMGLELVAEAGEDA